MYGKKAFPTDYPDFIDQRVGRNGSAIWVHGTSKPLNPMESNGCVAMNNDDILSLAPYLMLGEIPVVMVDTIDYVEPGARELEKKIKNHKRGIRVKKKTRADIYRIDEFGNMTCVSWIRPLTKYLIILALCLILIASSFVYLFFQGSLARTELVERIDGHERTIRKLTRDREVLMAQLVMSGTTPDLESMVDKEPEPLEEDTFQPSDGESSGGAIDNEEGQAQEERSENQVPPLNQSVKPGSNGGNFVEIPEGTPPIVGIEEIQVLNDTKGGDLFFNFNIKNISDDLDTISGYIFVVLKPGSNLATDWLVIPSTPIERGRPSLFKRGQYFSISRFKPVNFRVKSGLSPGDFELASIFVYDEDGRLIAMHNVNL